MSIKVVSTTEQESPAPEKETESRESVSEQQNESASEETSDETAEESETSGAKDGDKLEAKDGEESDSDDESESESKDDRPKKSNGFKKRIDRMNRRLTEKEQELEYWKQQALAQGQSVQKDQPKAEKKAATADSSGRPNADDFDTHEAYFEKLAEWKFEQKQKAIEDKSREEQARTSFQDQKNKFQERAKSFAKEHSDYDEVLSEVDDVPVSGVFHQVLMESEFGPEIAYTLAKDAAEFARIQNLNPVALGREIGKLEARLAKSAVNEKTEKKTTKAPRPLEPVGRSASGSVKKSIWDKDISQGDYERLRRLQMEKRA